MARYDPLASATGRRWHCTRRLLSERCSVAQSERALNRIASLMIAVE